LYLFSYAAYNEEANELYAEYHLGRLAFRLCKQVLRSALVPLHLTASKVEAKKLHQEYHMGMLAYRLCKQLQCRPCTNCVACNEEANELYSENQMGMGWPTGYANQRSFRTSQLLLLHGSKSPFYFDYQTKIQIFLGKFKTKQILKTKRPMYFVFCRLYPRDPKRRGVWAS
jgi:hypothetical protein